MGGPQKLLGPPRFGEELGFLGLFGEEPNNCSIPQIRVLILFPHPGDGSQFGDPPMTSLTPDQPVGR